MLQVSLPAIPTTTMAVGPTAGAEVAILLCNPRGENGGFSVVDSQRGVRRDVLRMFNFASASLVTPYLNQQRAFRSF